jgi:transcriptional regulator with XRE-family HTH domain
MPKPRPPSLGAVLRFYRFALGWTEKDLARALGIRRPVLISEYERGTKELSRERLEELLAVMGLPPETIDAALYALAIAPPPANPGSPVDPSPAERRSLYRTAAVAGLRAVEATLERLTANLRRRHAAGARRQAARLWKTLQGLAPEQRRLAVERERRYWQWALAERVAADSARAAAHQAGQAVELASLALRLAELALVGETFRCRLQGYVLGFVANSLRVQGELRAAEEAFLRSDQLWEAGAAADPGLLDGSRLLDLKASLRTYQGRFQEALALLDQARLASRSEEAWGRFLIKKATNLELMGQHEQAIATLREAENLAEGARAPRQLFLIRFTLVSNLKELEKYTEAEALLPEVRQLAEGLGNELDVIRVRWLEAGLAAALGRREEALAALEQVRRYFTVKRIAFDAALASLELAVLELEQGRTAEVKRLTAGMLWIFEAQGVHQEALAALRLFCEAVQKEEATAGLARRVTEYLRKARHNPELRFQA